MDTPCLLIEEPIMRANLAQMAAQCNANGCALRPHIKTHKSVALARIQEEYGINGITISKLREGEIMAEAGFTDLFMAYPIVGREKIQRAGALAKKVRLILSVDSIEGAKALNEGAEHMGVSFEVRLEIDTGMGRSGVLLEQAVPLAKAVSTLPHLRLTGISTYRNMIYHGQPHSDRMLCGQEEVKIMVSLQKELLREGIEIREVSTGSTATAVPCAAVGGITEVRPGTYIFYDRMQEEKGACTPDMFAAFVETTVISVKGNLVVIDAGTKSISTDCPGVAPHSFSGFGRVIGHDQLLLDFMTEEHGMLTNHNPHDCIRVGDRLRIIPNHICTTVNMYDQAYLFNDGLAVCTIQIDARGANY